MAEAFLGEIRIFSFGFAPSGWAKCDGQTMQIAQNQALYSILGVTYGGNGITTFNLPNLQGRVPIHKDASHPLGSAGGEADHTLVLAEIPSHTHTPMASGAAADQASPNGNYWAGNPTYMAYSAQPSSNVSLAVEAVAAAGAGLAHPNMSPYLPLNFCIALYGVYPSQS